MKLYKYSFNGNDLHKLMALPMMCAMLMLFPSLSNATILLDADWEKENATFEDYYTKISNNKNGVKIVDSTKSNVPTCQGTKSVQHQLIYGVLGPWSQLVLKGGGFDTFEIGKEHWFAFAVYLPKDYAPDFTAGEMIWELHGRKDGKLGEVPRNAPLAIRTKGTQWFITHKLDTKQLTEYDADGKPIYEDGGRVYLGDFETGKWTTFVINTLYDYKPQGYAKIWKDGELVFHKKNGIGFNDRLGPFIKFGLYKPKWGKVTLKPSDVTSRTLYIDDFRVGDADTTYAEIAPNCNGSPKLKPIPPADFQVR
jgi:hypothetical protein